MELRHVLGSTYVAVAATALLPIYKLNDTDIVLLDTGYAKLDRSGLTHLLEDNGFHLKGILCSHAHFDHTGNVRYLQQRYGAIAAAQIIEAGISVNPDAYRANYVALTYGRSRAYFLEECFTADVIISADATELDFCGVKFGILQAARPQRRPHRHHHPGRCSLPGGLSRLAARRLRGPSSPPPCSSPGT